MSFEHLIAHFGYPALVVGLLLEGETAMMLAAFMAHRGYLSLSLVILIGCLVSFGSDQFFFWMGRLKGRQFLEKRPAWQPRVEKAKAMLGRNVNLLFLSVRFMYGLRTVLPFVIGMSEFDPKRFAFLNFIGAFVWALVFGLAGKLIGHIMGAIFEDVKEYESMIIAAILFTGVCVWIYFRYKNQVRKIEN